MAESRRIGTVSHSSTFCITHRRCRVSKVIFDIPGATLDRDPRQCALVGRCVRSLAGPQIPDSLLLTICTKISISSTSSRLHCIALFLQNRRFLDQLIIHSVRINACVIDPLLLCRRHLSLKSCGMAEGTVKLRSSSRRYPCCFLYARTSPPAVPIVIRRLDAPVLVSDRSKCSAV